MAEAKVDFASIATKSSKIIDLPFCIARLNDL
jgi:hypothetical protein